MKRLDFIIGALILIMAGGLLLFNQFLFRGASRNTKSAAIYVDGNLYQSKAIVEQEQQFEIKTKYGINVVRIRNGGVEMVEASCPDKLCIGFGFKQRVGEQIVCLPNRMHIEVKGETDDPLDGTTR